MRESGGPTTQSGIFYQNCLSALYLGKLLDSRSVEDAARIISVRCEAPTAVDDIVVTFADGHRLYIQAKENIQASGSTWSQFWQHFEAQFTASAFQHGRDRIQLHVGTGHPVHHDLQALCERAINSENHLEWQNRITLSQQSLVNTIKPYLSPILQNDNALFEFFCHVEVEIATITQIWRDIAPNWMPASNKYPKSLLRLLVARVANEARVRGVFTAPELSQELKQEDGVEFHFAPDIKELIDAIQDSGALLRQHKRTFAKTGHHLDREIVKNIVTWASEQDSANVGVLLDQAGMGKTVVMQDVQCSLELQGIYVLAVKADQELAGIKSHDDLQQRLRLPDTVERVVGRVSALKRVVMLLDQIDALSLSLARDQEALNIVMGLVARLRQLPGVRVLLSCRTFDYKSDPRLKQINIDKEFLLDPLSDTEIQTVLLKIGTDWNSLSSATQKLLRVPLHLDIFSRIMTELPQERHHTQFAISSLQELYAAMWSEVVCKPQSDGPSPSEREEVLRQVTQYMDREQSTSVPQSFSGLQSERLVAAVTWLASAGILIAGAGQWNYLHQTFFDYCYARQFVERGESLIKYVMEGDQGLVMRPRLVQVLAYMRGSNQKQYFRELQALTTTFGLRFHLRDLLMRWFASLPNPIEAEWHIAYRRIINSATRREMLQVMSGNMGWLSWLKGDPMSSLLKQSDEVIDNEVIPFLASVLTVAQKEVVDILRPFLGKNDRWNRRMNWMFSYLRDWHTPDAVDLYEQLLRIAPPEPLDHMVALGDIAKLQPEAGCRIIQIVLDTLLDRIPGFQDDGPFTSGLSRALEEFNNGIFVEAVNRVAVQRPQLFVELMLPWFDRATLMKEADVPGTLYFPSDTLSYGWDNGVYVMRTLLIQALADTLVSLARTEQATFLQAAARLEALSSQSPQRLLARVYAAVPDQYAEEGFRFLVFDKRRLRLGEGESNDTRHLITAIYPYLGSDQSEQLEKIIADAARIRKWNDLNGLHWRGLDQLYLFQAIPGGCRSKHGRRCFEELTRKFPNRYVSGEQQSFHFREVMPPIPNERTSHMSDRSWLQAMRPDKSNINRRGDFPPRGAQLSSLLQAETKREPKRFYHLAMDRMPLDSDANYIMALLTGLSESEAPSEWLFELVRKFASRPDKNIQHVIAWQLKRHAQQGLPDDLLSLMEDFISLPEDDAHCDSSENDAYTRHINSPRGTAYDTLMEALLQQADEESIERLWKLIEYAAEDLSTPLRAGALHALLFIQHHERERAIQLYSRLIEGHPNLLYSDAAQNFPYYAMSQNFTRLLPCLHAFLEHPQPNCQQKGAELVSLAFISPSLFVSEQEHDDARALAMDIVQGRPSWRRGAAHVFAANLTGRSSALCIENLLKLINDSDKEVRQYVAGFFYRCDTLHIELIREFVEKFAASRSLHEGLPQFAEFLGKYGLVEPDWTLSVIRTALDNIPEADAPRHAFAGEKLIRLVLRIHTDPTSNDEIRRQAMDLFDVLMQRYQGEAQITLHEWDTR